MMMTKENGINNDIGIAAGAFQDFTKRVIGTQNELLKKYSEAYWHWQERLQTESTQLTEFFKEVSSTTSAPDQIGVSSGLGERRQAAGHGGFYLFN
ncbi:hypothetical protein ACVMDN_000459 [Bradyrhizobium sp. USDA 4510]